MTDNGVLTLFWTGNTGIGRVITLLLFALGAAAAAAALRHRERYRGRETATLNKVRARLVDMRAREHPDDAPEQRAGSPPPVDIHELGAGIPADTLIGDRLGAITRMKQARVKVDIDALQQMTALRESAVRSLAFPGYAVDLSMMLGMLGTFLGLCLMLLHMQAVVPAASGLPAAGGFDEAANSLARIIADKKTAFATTLVGVACAIVVSWLNFLLARAQQAFYGELERFTAADLLPATVPTVEDEVAMERLSLQLTEALATLGTLVQGHTDNVGRLQAIEAAFGATVDSIRDTMRHAGHAPAEEAAGALTTLVRQLTDANEALVRVAESVAGAALRERRAAEYGGGAGGWLEQGLEALRRNPLLALAGVVAAVSLAVLIW